ncbi:tetratricopeptide repeat protein [Roseicyclus persicicus]|uniref:Sel1 repeat family protein n=1 Tax=Roseicyclus persicicus TaxID=2650661 RepID=A0A7X6H1P9_9RHOB|nr:sel1 repeat family protein [Roseibacterium persicicum]NKX46419.1 sel1 repeat family protein [Roseibacterium persicicum]
MSLRAALVALVLALSPVTAGADPFAAELARIETGLVAIESGDFDTAERVFRQEAEAGNLSARVWLGILMTVPESPVFDLARGMAILEAGAAAGHPAGASALGRIHSEGRPGLPADPAAAEAQFARALALDPADPVTHRLLVNHRLTMGSRTGDFGPLHAALAPGLAAHPDDPFLRLARGLTALHGAGVPVDPAAALADFEVAAAGGNLLAMQNAAALLSNGADGLPRDPEGAFRMYGMMAEAGDPDGQVLMAGALLAGDGVAADPVAARALVDAVLARDPGNPSALMMRASIDALGDAGRADPAVVRARLAELGIEGLDAAGIELVMMLMGPVAGSEPADAVEVVARCEVHRDGLLAAGAPDQAAATEEICAAFRRQLDPARLPDVAARAAAIRAAAPAAP